VDHSNAVVQDKTLVQNDYAVREFLIQDEVIVQTKL
jgi:hypothetical protein